MTVARQPSLRHAEAAAPTGQFDAASRADAATETADPHRNGARGICNTGLGGGARETVAGSSVAAPSPGEVHDAITAMLAAATAAQRRDDHATAQRIWMKLRLRFPDHPAGYVRAAMAHLASGAPELAERLIQEGRTRCPNHIGFLRVDAAVAEARQDWQGALSLWQSFVAHAPRSPEARHGVGKVLLKLERLQEAEDWLADAARRFPDHFGIAAAHALVATTRKDWDTALTRWGALLEGHPERDAVAERHAEALRECGRTTNGTPPAQLSGVRAVSPRVTAGTQQGALSPKQHPDAREVLAKFESLGSNCEFGLLQRRFRLEPLGLLRWSNANPERLCRLLETRFQGLGSPEHTQIKLNKTGVQYNVKDTAFGLIFHTFIKANAQQEAEILRSECRRLHFLAEKLADDLGEGKKIFVYKRLDPGQPRPDFARLRAAMNKYGRNTLLYVELANARNPCGVVREAADGVLRGYIDRVGPREDEQWDISIDAWLTICREALRMTGLGG